MGASSRICPRVITRSAPSTGSPPRPSTCTRSSVSAPGARDRPRPKQPPQRQSAPNNKPTTQTTNLNNLLEGLLTSRRERRFYERLHSEDFFTGLHRENKMTVSDTVDSKWRCQRNLTTSTNTSI